MIISTDVSKFSYVVSHRTFYGWLDDFKIYGDNDQHPHDFANVIEVLNPETGRIVVFEFQNFHDSEVGGYYGFEPDKHYDKFDVLTYRSCEDDPDFGRNNKKKKKNNELFLILNRKPVI